MAGGVKCTTTSFDVLVGADGAHSAVAAFTGMPYVKPADCLAMGRCAPAKAVHAGNGELMTTSLEHSRSAATLKRADPR
eukprot:3051263-Prymnesium_polylepis.1